MSQLGDASPDTQLPNKTVGILQVPFLLFVNYKYVLMSYLSTVEI